MSRVLFCENFGFTFSRSRTPTVKSVSFTLERGEYLSIIGPNGSGKSTLLKCFLRLHETGHTTGRLSVCERNLDSYSQRELARLIGYVPQAGGRVPPFTVTELLKLSRYPYASRQDALHAEDRGEIGEALALTNTEHLANKRLDAISGGERQRAYLAAALAQGTDILLLDEPASFLDPKHAAELNALLKHLNRERRMTVITVTHDLNHPVDAGGKVLVVRHGEQTYFGPTEALEHEGVLEETFGHPFVYLKHPATGKTLVFAEQP